MASELTAQAKIKFTPDSDLKNEGFETDAIAFTRTLTGTDSQAYNTQVIGTTEETLSLGSDLTTPFVCIKNLDDSNFVEVGLTGSYPMKVLAGEFACFRTNGTIYAKADTADVTVQFWAVEL